MRSFILDVARKRNSSATVTWDCSLVCGRINRERYNLPECIRYTAPDSQHRLFHLFQVRGHRSNLGIGKRPQLTRRRVPGAINRPKRAGKARNSKSRRDLGGEINGSGLE